MTCPFCEENAFNEYDNRHINRKPYGKKKILLTLESGELKHLEDRVQEGKYRYDNMQHYLRILIHKDINRVHRLKISEPAEPDI